jgi:hypothetical protein
MARRRGWARRGARLVERAPHGRWRTPTFPAARRRDRIEAPCVFDGPIHGRAFTAHVERLLLPTLAPGGIVGIDPGQRRRPGFPQEPGRPPRHPAGGRRAVLPAAPGRRRCRARPLDRGAIKLIEQAFAKLQHLVQGAAERSVDAARQRIGECLDRFPPAECANCLRNCGYAATRYDPALAHHGRRRSREMSEAKTTTDHEAIRAWAEARGGHPATVKRTGDKDNPGILRFDFDDGEQEASLERISWDEFFDKFEESKLALLHQDKTKDGKTSRFFKFVHRDEKG